MKKDYQKWMGVKSDINNNGKRPEKYHEGGVYWVYLGENIGMEQDGHLDIYSRPALIVSGFSKEIVLCIPISHTIKRSKFYFRIKQGEINGSLVLSQIKSIDTLRIGNYITTINQATLIKVKWATAALIIGSAKK